MTTDYERIEKAIIYLKENFRNQPELDEIAEYIHLSPSHFQRMFKEWAGVSPKKFLQFLTVEYAKNLLHKNLTLADATYETGLSGTGRLHDLFVSIEGMTPGELKNGGDGLTINFSFAESPFGDIIIASTHKGICHLSFVPDKASALTNLTNQFPRAVIQQKTDVIQQRALHFFSGDWSDLQQVKLHLKGTPFQLKVWQSLLHVPFGNLTTYSSIAENIRHSNASRAVGTAIGHNPVAFLIPCHRVIKNTGITGEYHWGPNRKTAILGWEAAKISTNE